MSTDSFKLDPRGRQDVVEGMGRIAAGAEGDAAWVSLLFEEPSDPRGGRHRLRDETEPSSSVLNALAHVFADSVLSTLNEVPALARESFFSRRLGVAQRNALTDHVITLVTGSAAQLPITVPSGTALTCQDEETGANRRYLTRDALTVLPTRMEFIGSYRRFADGYDIGMMQPLSEGVLTAPFDPFGSRDAPGRVSIPHRLYIESPLLTAAMRRTELTVRFSGVSPGGQDAIDILDTLQWDATTAEGFKAIPKKRFQIDGEDVVASFTLEFDVAPVAAEKETPGVKRDLIRDGPAVWAGRVPSLRLSVADPDSDPYAFKLRGAARFFSFRDVSLRFSCDDHAASPPANEGQELPPGTPFMPFGPVPRVGESFYIGCGEVFGLPIERLSLTLHDVEGRATGMEIVSLHDEAGPVPDTDPAVTWQAFRNETWTSLPEAARPTGDVGAPGSTFGGTVAFEEAIVAPALSGRTVVAARGGHYLRATLRQCDFGWSRYEYRLAEFARRSAEQARRRRSLLVRTWQGLMALIGIGEPKKDDEGEQPTPSAAPKPPVLTSVTVKYSSAPIGLSDRGEEVCLFAENTFGPPTPTGENDTGVVVPFAGDPTLWPGTVFVGFTALEPGLPIAMFMEIHPTRTQIELGRAPMKCEYYVDGRWKQLEVADGTNGLRQTGLVHWRAPEDWVESEPLPSLANIQKTDLSWIRISTMHPERAGKIHQVALNAGWADAQFGDDPDARSVRPLPAGSRFVLEQALPGITGITNPMTSAGGLGRENRAAYLRRAGAFIRHRDRSLTALDVERLVLDNFPGIELALCLPHTRGTCRCTPGSVVLVLVPDLPGRLPLADDALRAEVIAFLGPRCSGNAHIQLLDPAYTELEIEAKVKIVPGTSLHEADNRITADLHDYVHPLSSRGGSQRFGTPLSVSMVRRFLDTHDDVAEVESIAFVGAHAGCNVVRARGPRGLLTSAIKHHVEVAP